MKKKLLLLPLAFSLMSTPLLSVIGCSTKERIEAKLPENLNDVFFTIFKSLQNKNYISEKSLFEKFKGKINNYGLQVIKEAITRNESIRLHANYEQKNFSSLTEAEKDAYDQQFMNDWDELATNILYQEYLKARIAGNIFESSIVAQGFELNQTDDWHILGTWNDKNQETYKDTKEKEITELLTLDETELTKFKKDLVHRFQNYYNQKIRPSLLDNLFLMVWLKNRMFKITKTAKGTIFSLNQRYLVPQAIQTWDEYSIWKSKVKMVWEMKVKVNEKDNLLPGNNQTNKLFPDQLDTKLKSKENQIKTLNDPIFNMAGFRGFATYKSDSDDLYGDNTMDEIYKKAVFNQNTVGFANEKPSENEEIIDFYSSDRNYISQVYVVPFYLLDLLEGYKVAGKSIEIDANLKYKWLNNVDKNNSDITNQHFNNNLIKALSQEKKDSIFNYILYAISKNSSEYENSAAKELYVRYIQNKENVLDKTIWENIKGKSIFPTEE